MSSRKRKLSRPRHLSRDCSNPVHKAASNENVDAHANMQCQQNSECSECTKATIAEEELGEESQKVECNGEPVAQQAADADTASARPLQAVSPAAMSALNGLVCRLLADPQQSNDQLRQCLIDAAAQVHHGSQTLSTVAQLVSGPPTDLGGIKCFLSGLQQQQLVQMQLIQQIYAKLCGSNRRQVEAAQLSPLHSTAVATSCAQQLSDSDDDEAEESVATAAAQQRVCYVCGEVLPSSQLLRRHLAQLHDDAEWLQLTRANSAPVAPDAAVLAARCDSPRSVCSAPVLAASKRRLSVDDVTSDGISSSSSSGRTSPHCSSIDGLSTAQHCIRLERKTASTLERQTLVNGELSNLLNQHNLASRSNFLPLPLQMGPFGPALPPETTLQLHNFYNAHNFLHAAANCNSLPQSLAFNALLDRHPSTSEVDNSDDWEAMMEVTSSNETDKLQQLFEKIEASAQRNSNGISSCAVTASTAAAQIDANQCAICRRVLSCKSALQMHYRTHTGERPFKCKICQRAFTTKGNLKTHMGVHKTKPPLRLLHGCPVCHKKFTNPFLMQQHLKMHSCLDRPLPLASLAALPPMLDPSAALGLAALQPHLMPHITPLLEQLYRHHIMPHPIASISNCAAADSDGPPLLQPEEPLQPSMERQQHSPATPAFVAEEDSSSPTVRQFESKELKSVLRLHKADSEKANSAHQVAPLLPIPKASPFSSVMLPTPRQISLLTGRPHTTCNICLKTFACNSALEIHYRSHTKERPFKCQICGRGFSTKGNMKQHLLTHKIRELPQPATPVRATQSVPIADELTTSIKRAANDSAWPMSSAIAVSQSSSILFSNAVHQALMHSHALDNANGTKSSSSSPSTSHAPDSTIKNTLLLSPVLCDSDNSLSEINPLESMEKMWAQTEPTPAPRRPPMLSKHQCQVCFKHFSSASALQIHTRTHTGDKPFKCPSCERAFTTKGNLKVHMGTHMWNNSNRRGRRTFDNPLLPMNGAAARLPGCFSRPAGVLVHHRPETSASGDNKPLLLNGLFQSSSLPIDVPQMHSYSGGVNGVAEEQQQLSPVSSDTEPSYDSAEQRLQLTLPTKASFISPLSGIAIPSTAALSPFFSAFPPNRPNQFFDGFANCASAALPSSAQQAAAMMWMWRQVCSVCRKVCASPGELEDHLKMHLKLPDASLSVHKEAAHVNQ